MPLVVATAFAAPLLDLLSRLANIPPFITLRSTAPLPNCCLFVW